MKSCKIYPKYINIIISLCAISILQRTFDCNKCRLTYSKWSHDNIILYLFCWKKSHTSRCSNQTQLTLTKIPNVTKCTKHEWEWAKNWNERNYENMWRSHDLVLTMAASIKRSSSSPISFAPFNPPNEDWKGKR